MRKQAGLSEVNGWWRRWTVGRRGIGGSAVEYKKKEKGQGWIQGRVSLRAEGGGVRVLRVSGAGRVCVWIGYVAI